MRETTETNTDERTKQGQLKGVVPTQQAATDFSKGSHRESESKRQARAERKKKDGEGMPPGTRLRLVRLESRFTHASKNGPKVATNDAAKAGASRCQTSQSLLSDVGAVAKSTSER